jgi:hypothetical protein
MRKISESLTNLAKIGVGFVKGGLWMAAWVFGIAAVVFAVRYPFYHDDPVRFFLIASTFVLVPVGAAIVYVVGFRLIEYKAVRYTLGGLVALLIVANLFTCHSSSDGCVENRYQDCPR